MKINEIVRKSKVPNVVVHPSIASIQNTLNVYANKIVKNKIRQRNIKQAWETAKRIALRKNKLFNKFNTKGNVKVR